MVAEGPDDGPEAIPAFIFSPLATYPSHDLKSPRPFRQTVFPMFSHKGLEPEHKPSLLQKNRKQGVPCFH